MDQLDPIQIKMLEIGGKPYQFQLKAITVTSRQQVRQEEEDGTRKEENEPKMESKPEEAVSQSSVAKLTKHITVCPKNVI